MSGGTEAAWTFGGDKLGIGPVLDFEPDRGNSFGRDLQLSMLATAGAGNLTCTFGGAPCELGRPRIEVGEVAECDPIAVPAGQDLASFAPGASQSGTASAVQPARYPLGRPPPPTLVIFRSAAGVALTLPAVAVRGLQSVGEWPAVLLRDARGRPGWLAIEEESGLATLYPLGAYPFPPVDTADRATLLADPASIGR